MSTATPDLIERTETTSETISDRPWSTQLINDEFNSMDYVIHVLQEVLQIEQSKAVGYMLTAHKEGKAAVFSGGYEKARGIAQRLNAHMLMAEVVKDD